MKGFRISIKFLKNNRTLSLGTLFSDPSWSTCSYSNIFRPQNLVAHESISTVRRLIISHHVKTGYLKTDKDECLRNKPLLELGQDP